MSRLLPLALLPLLACGSPAATVSTTAPAWADSCGAISNSDLRYYCQSNCGAVSNSDLRYYCQGNYGAISSSDVRYYGQGNCGAISSSDLRYLCQSGRKYPGPH